jgi:hypothetical protein
MSRRLTTFKILSISVFVSAFTSHVLTSKKTLKGRRRVYEDNIISDLKEIGSDDAVRIHLPEGRRSGLL